MNVIEISCPAKTFVVGEYAVLDEGPAIVFNTSPRFVCRIQKSSKKSKNLSQNRSLVDSRFRGNDAKNGNDAKSGNEGFELFKNLSANSPSGQWVKKNPQDFQSVQLEWIDDYHKKSGLGFSSAQFNILYAYTFILRQGNIDQIKPQEVWRSYRSLKFDGFLPSGADIITQWVGGVTVFEQNPLHVETLISHLPDLECMILRTGDSFPTYKYLKSLKIKDVSDLKKIAQLAVSAIKQRQEEAFLSAVNDYRIALQKQGYTTGKSIEILDRLKKVKAIKALKACGAMGAETLIVFYKKEDEEEVKQELSFLEFVADGQQLTYGVSFHKLTKKEEVMA